MKKVFKMECSSNNFRSDATYFKRENVRQFTMAFIQ